MSRHLQGTRAQCDTWKAAFDADAGCPIRGVTVGGPDRTHPTVPGPGWTMEVVYQVLQANAGLAVLEVPDDQTHRFGRGPIPPNASAKNDADLPQVLLALVRARRSQDANGNPLPLSGQVQGQGSGQSRSSQPEPGRQ